MFDGEDLDAVVYDLDGTLVSLPIDWGEAINDITAILDDHDVTPPENFWDTFESVDGTSHQEAAEATLAAYERDAARSSEQLVPADALVEVCPPVGVCSLNCEAACRIALETHGLESDVDCVVGRDTVATCKPDPGPLLHTVEQLSATPECTLFVGDTATDEQTAIRAGTQFKFADNVI